MTEAEPKSSRKPRGRTGSNTRQTVLNAARAVVEEHGYAGTTAYRITELAGCSRPTFYVYFSSKDDVFQVLAEEVKADFLRAQTIEDWSPSMSAQDIAARTVTEYFDVYLRHYRFMVVLEHQSLTMDWAWDTFATIHDDAVQNSVLYMQALVDAGAAEPVLELPKLAKATTAMIHNSARVVSRNPARRDSIIDEIITAHLTLLGVPESDDRDGGVPAGARTRQPTGI